MGKRSRRQRSQAGDGESEAPKRGEQLRQRASVSAAAAERNIKARPPAPWDPFPLTELGILLGLICLAIGFFSSGDLRKAMFAAGFTLGVLGGLDTVLREHFNGYRTHAGMLAGMLALLALIVSTALVKIGIAPRAAIAIGVFALSYPMLRRGFIRRSGGRRA
jgi:hypothetical protein